MFFQIQIDQRECYKTYSQSFWTIWVEFDIVLTRKISFIVSRNNEDIFNPFSKFVIVYIDYMLVFSTSIDQHLQNPKVCFNIIKDTDLVLTKIEYSLFQINIIFHGHNVEQGINIPIQQSIILLINFLIKVFTKPNSNDF